MVLRFAGTKKKRRRSESGAAVEEDPSIKPTSTPKALDTSSWPLLLKNIDRWRVRIGMSLHVGWAIEGAIGSRHKVDASYLSPHVNISARLEAATKQYGVSLLLSEAFYSELTPTMQEECRGRLRRSRP